MIRLLFSSLIAISALLSTGCLFSKKPRAPKESTAIASEVEEGFRQRWVDQRTSQLVAQGVAAATARTQADIEFRERFGFIKSGRK